MSYTEKEIRAFKLKDILNSRMSALKAASLLYESAGCDLGHPTDTVLGTADKYFKWVRQDQDNVGGTQPKKDLEDKVLTEEIPRDKQLPEPTLAQKKVLDAIMDKGIVCDGDTFRKQVLDWAEEVHGQRSYPTKLDSVETFLKWHKTL